MKIVHVHPGCGIPVPPITWGAIEKLIWDLKINQEKLGHEVDVKYADSIEAGDYDIIHCHVANLAIGLAERGIPYIYQLHDHHAYHNGKDSHVYNQNLKAIEGSLISLMPAKYLVNYFDSGKCRYFSHGVDNEFFKPDPNKEKERKFLMLANNGLAGDSSFDRKGFGFGIALAALLDETITIAGPSNNKNWFNSNLWALTYPKLQLHFDLNPEQVRDLYQTHEVFLHPTMLEAGHPNLTMVEAAACGMPIIADWEMETDFHGAWRAPRDVFAMNDGYKDIVSKWDFYVERSLNTAKELDWSNRAKELIEIYQQFI